ncbi:DUF2806 domain-containing protein [Pseudomonas sp. TCU-HL1]|uniref:DUF2806 domain-containing protein n=1 Tax=Pseudomonas sp. TCU-HL1 TaxID=1856685 RepID=UPI00083E27E4|nr:DUF2806 domain-containing protein [Pseudomonas sp. TCU-HL1]AOE85850.1 hypothetical protein THL1_3302 [Pseudomonas sp. TCU-HL1]
MGENKSMTDISSLSEPAVRLIEKISNAVGVLYEPTRIVRLAAAEAHADLIKFNSRRQLSQLEQRAVSSFLQRETVKQENIESITGFALDTMSADATPEELDDTWLAYFFRQCELIKNKDMQKVWGQILAREAEGDSAFSLRTISALALMNHSDAEMFSRFCQFVALIDGNPELLIFDVNDKFYRDAGVNFGETIHLQSIGLVTYSDTGYTLNVTKHVVRDDFYQEDFLYTLSYFDQNLSLRYPLIEDGILRRDEILLSTGQVNLTEVGRELFYICSARPKDGFVGYYEKWLKKEDIGLVLNI